MEQEKKKLDSKVIIQVVAIVVALVIGIFIGRATMNDKGITLTKENFEDYFNVPFASDPSGNLYMSVRAYSSNFNYENVEITFRVKSKSGEFETKTFAIKCNITGDGSSNEKIGTTNKYDISYEVVNIKGKLKPIGE